jgi:pimeloyl-ACP methyl ester carboxylesterase
MSPGSRVAGGHGVSGRPSPPRKLCSEATSSSGATSRRPSGTSVSVTDTVDVPRGGHFPALEQPQLFVDELRTFFRLVR